MQITCDDDGKELVIFTKEELAMVLKALHKLKEDGPKCKSFGICSNLDDYAEVHGVWVYYFVSHYARGWEYHTGNNNYPVPCIPGECELWKGRHAVMRYNLIDYLIKKVEGEM